MTTRPLALPGAFDDAIGEQLRNFLRVIGAAVEHDDQLVAEIERLQALGELRLFVMGNDDCGDKGAAAAHAALLSARDHKPRAAASTASTDRVSIRVSVVRWSKSLSNWACHAASLRTVAVQAPHGA